MISWTTRSCSPTGRAQMRGVCDDVLKAAPRGTQVVPGIVTVAGDFARLQHQRHTAHYDNAAFWSLSDTV